MLLIDALYINNSGGKILLDYLISELEKTDESIKYFLDIRIKENHPLIKKSNTVIYCKGSLIKRHFFYKKLGKSIDKVFCFGNIPPTLKLEIPVYTYFHQRLFIKIPEELAFSQKIILWIKSKFFQKFTANSQFWIMQTKSIKNEFLHKFQNIEKHKIIFMPFYPPFSKAFTIVDKEKNSFLYVSNGSPHKNHQRLLKAFVKFYQKYKTGKLYITIGNEFLDLKKSIAAHQKKGVPIVNVGFLNRKELYSLYTKSEFVVFPSLTESFGLGLLEAMENGCKVVGADLPYTHAVCKPSLLFNPYEIDSIATAFYNAITKNTRPTEQLVFNEIKSLIKLLKNNYVKK